MTNNKNAPNEGGDLMDTRVRCEAPPSRVVNRGATAEVHRTLQSCNERILPRLDDKLTIGVLLSPNRGAEIKVEVTHHHFSIDGPTRREFVDPKVVARQESRVTEHQIQALSVPLLNLVGDGPRTESYGQSSTVGQITGKKGGQRIIFRQPSKHQPRSTK